MDTDDVPPVTPVTQPAVEREKTAPFLIRTFVKTGGFHRLTLFTDNQLPTTDEQQVYTWKDATLHEVLTTLRSVGPHTPEYRHPLARYTFRAVYADSTNRGAFTTKDLGTVYSRDILGEPGSLNAPATRLTEDEESTERYKDARTLDELRFAPGDYLCVSVTLPKGAAPPPDLGIKGAAGPGAANGWKSSGPLPPPRAPGSGPPTGRGGGHWRGGSDAPPLSAGRGRGRGRPDDFGPGHGRDRDGPRDRDRDRYDDRDRRPPLPRRDSPPPRRDSPPPRWGGERERLPPRRRSYSRSRSPPPRRR
ncbi:hypothetical protein PENSPDRAFT_599215 [Peniophora sp. CONT]|nr:hypothetical protein PENSPDRAFT_599215 [Peniophora sp. CONT]